MHMYLAGQETLPLDFAAPRPPVEPARPADTIWTYRGGRYIVVRTDDNIEGPVYICLCKETGREAIVLQREVQLTIRYTKKEGA